MAFNILIALSLLAALVEVKAQMCFSGSCGTNGLTVNSMEDCCLGDPLPTNSYYQPAGGECHPCIVIGFDPVRVTISEGSRDYETTQIQLLTDLDSLSDDYKDAKIELTVEAHTQPDNATLGMDFTIQHWSQPSTTITSFVLRNLTFDINIMAIDDEVLVEREEFLLSVTSVQYTVIGSVVHVAVVNNARVVIEDNDVIKIGFSRMEIEVLENQKEVQLPFYIITKINLVTHFCVLALTYKEYNETYQNWLKDYPNLPTHSLTNEFDQAELEDFSTRRTCFNITADSWVIPPVKIKLIDDDKVEPVHEGFRVLIVVDESEMPISHASFKDTIQLAVVRIDDYFDEITIGFLQEIFLIKVEKEGAIDLELQFDVISGSTEFPIILTIAIDDETSTARPGEDYIVLTPFHQTVKPPNTILQKFYCFPVFTRRDNTFDDDRSIVVQMRNEDLKEHVDTFKEGNIITVPQNRINLNPDTVTIIIQDSIEVYLTVPDVVDEGEAFFPMVTVSQPVNISFIVSVESDTAEVGLDFDVFNETVTLSFSQNQAITSIPIQTLMDQLVELTETFKVTIDLLEPSNLRNHVIFDKEFAPVNISNTNFCPAGAYARIGNTCTQCPFGSTSMEGAEYCDCETNYYWAIDEICLPCPANSTPSPGSQMCTCTPGHFRTSKESVSLPCTTSPSAPKIITVSTTATSINLSWQPPISDGGRDDVFYKLKYKENQQQTFSYYSPSPPIMTTTASIPSLKRNTIYSFQVVAENGVTQEFPDEFPEADRSSAVSLASTREACPAGTYARNGDKWCIQCPSNSTSKEGAVSCDCDANYYWTNDGICLPCPADSISQPGSEVCTCVFGYFRTSEDEVLPCTKPTLTTTTTTCMCVTPLVEIDTGPDTYTTSATSTSTCGTTSIPNILVSVFVTGFLSSAVTAVITSIVCLVIMRKRQEMRATTSKPEPTPIYDNITETKNNEMFQLKINAAYEHVSVNN